MAVSSICVYCGSSPGRNPEFLEAARLFGATLAGHRITVVYGGGDVGLMGALAEGALEAGGAVVGVIPQASPKVALSENVSVMFSAAQVL